MLDIRILIYRPSITCLYGVSNTYPSYELFILFVHLVEPILVRLRTPEHLEDIETAKERIFTCPVYLELSAVEQK